MTRTKLEELTVDELVERFADIGVKQYQALFREKISEFNQLYDHMSDVDNELKQRGPDARRALMRLYSHPNVQVRVTSGIRTLAVAADEAKSLLQTIADSRYFPQAADAALALDRLKDGSFVPR